MRPREIPAEARRGGRSDHGDNRASMRPREIPAEALGFSPAELEAMSSASMRPREIPAEARRSSGAFAGAREGFNEAAGDPRGSQLTVGELRRAGRLASMRPREIPAEAVGRYHDVVAAVLLASMRPREIPAEAGWVLDVPDARYAASMRPREIPAEATCTSFRTPWPAPGFNEAAGDPRGSRKDEYAPPWQPWASMRPREIPAEAVLLRSPSARA